MKIKLVCNVKECIHARLFLYIITSINNVTTSITYITTSINYVTTSINCYQINKPIKTFSVYITDNWPKPIPVELTIKRLILVRVMRGIHCLF